MKLPPCVPAVRRTLHGTTTQTQSGIVPAGGQEIQCIADQEKCGTAPNQWCCDSGKTCGQTYDTCN